MFFPFCFAIYFIYAVSGIQLALKVEHGNEFSLLFDASRNMAFCFPNYTVMGFLKDQTNHHNWGYSTSMNYTISIQRIGQVFCRQLGFPIFRSIMPIEAEESREKILWGASCLGYEPDISHCLYEEFVDNDVCNSFVGLSCRHCNRNIYLHTSETLALTSPGYSDLYYDGAICEWIIRTNTSMPILFKIRHLSLPNPNAFGRCSRGFLEIRSKNEDFEPYLIRQTFCGESFNMKFNIEGKIISLRLVAGVFHPRPNNAAGFHLTVSLLENFANGETGKSSFTSEEIVGIVVGVLAIIIIIVTLGILIKYSLVKKRRQRQRIATVLRKNIRPATPFVGFTGRKVPLPEIRINTENSPSTDSFNENKKHSFGSRIYEEVNQRSKSYTYLHLEDVRRTSVEKEVNRPNYQFSVPTILFTPENESPTQGTSGGYNSQPSDMPSRLSFGSEADSVFADDSYETHDLKTSIRNGTYTIVSKTNRSTTYNVEKAVKERHLSSPTSFWSKMRTEYLKLRYDDRRRSSEPSKILGGAEKIPIIKKTKSLSSEHN